MKLTNNFNLPDTFVNVIKRPQYSKGDSQISATEQAVIGYITQPPS